MKAHPIKRILLFTLIILPVLQSCRKENTPDNLNTQFNATASDTLISQGSFIDGNSGHAASGTVKIYRNADKQILRFENLKVDNGPALKVYLSKDRGNGDFIDLGDLKAVTGNFTYELDKNVNTKEYPFVVVWCVRFSVLFGSAELK